MKLYGVADVAEATGLSKRWVQKLASEFGVGTRVGQMLVFTDTEVARFRGEAPSHQIIHVPVHLAFMGVLLEVAALRGASVEDFASESVIEHLKRATGNG